MLRSPSPRARAARPVGHALLLGVAAAAALAPATRAAAQPIKVAVIGPQHVHSHQLTRDKEFPAMLQVLLGPGYQVGNFGDCCATVLRGYPRQRETHPYLEGGESYGEPMNFKDSVKFAPDIVIIAPFGKHDTEIANQLYKGVLDRQRFQMDYDALVTTYLELPSKPRVYVSLPIPIPFGMPAGVTTSVMLPAVREVAAARRLPVIDLYTPFLNQRALYKDETHVTNDAGLHLIADTVFAAMNAASDAGAPADAVADTAPPVTPADAAADAAPAGAGGGGGAGGNGAAGGAGGGGSGANAGTGGGAGAGVTGGAGSTPATGGAPATIGSGGAGAPGPADEPTPSACACRVGAPSGHAARAPAATMWLLLLAAPLLRRRRRR
jgi:acyl-CoA thioesterase I